VAVVQAPVPAPPPAEAPEPATESETAPVVEAAPAPDDPEPEAGPTVEPESESGPPPASPDEVIAWVVQVGSFGARENATGLAERLREAGFAAFVEPYRANGRALFRVKVGPTTAREDAEALQARLIGEQDLKQSIVVSHP
jgi:DedD protein